MGEEIIVNTEEAKNTLIHFWETIQQKDLDSNFDEEFSSAISSLLRSNTRSYRYVLPTQLLAKVVNPKVNATCLQKRSAVVGHFDARTLCHKVVVPFEREQGKPLGGSPEPYVNNPLRVPEVSSEHRNAQKDKDGWDQLCAVLNEVQKRGDKAFSERIFLQVLLEIRKIQNEQTVTYSMPQRISLEHSMAMFQEFLKPKTGGGRLQAVCVALFRTIGEFWGIYDEVLSAVVNASDASGERPADIDCRKDGKTVLAVEVKDRTVTLQLLEDKIATTRLARVEELLFLIRSEPIVESQEVYERAQREFASGQNIYLLHVDVFMEQILSLIGEDGRLLLIEKVGNALEEFRLDFKDRKDWADILVK
ncbi:restriction endonuclease, SacI family [Alicyclobacillus tolerans]|uniref:SacI restriction endonuclease n=1 Tax=Alicyclobacillus tolerans TaxID=90970 RepID=A0A1M6XY28_9BACL|nr:restriction endonuclease, SacI family [Alicyclobacillus montanus]SHK64337.1 SacI restriction endonuclease [Alicyclobacillus montanus]SHL10715.1 SacI restriction endonuclease [Alicyclobacillus montanus]